MQLNRNTVYKVCDGQMRLVFGEGFSIGGELLHLLLCLFKEEAAFVPAALHKGSILGLFKIWKQN